MPNPLTPLLPLSGDITDVYGVNDDSVKLLPSIDTGVHSGTPTAIPAAMSVVTYRLGLQGEQYIFKTACVAQWLRRRTHKQ